MGILTPTWWVTAIYALTPEHLKERGIQAVLTDLDNTLIAWNDPNGSAALCAWLTAMHDAGLTVMVVSNNNADRVGKALANLQLPFVARALKPLPVGINRAVAHLGLSKDAVVMVGDQLLTDVAAGNLAGVRTIAVRPLIETDAWNTRFNRFVEGFVMRAKSRRGALNYQEDLNDK